MGTEKDIARAFVDARREATGLADYPGPMPATLDDAYQLQARAILLTGGTVAGWKVGKIPPPHEQNFGANRLVGPIFADLVVASQGTDSTGPDMAMFADGFGAAEAEFLVQIKALPSPDLGVPDFGQVLDYISAVHVGIEIASSPFPGINEYGPAVTISDFGNNYGLVVGEAVSGWESRAFENWPVSLEIDGKIVGEAIAADMLDGPIGAARFLFGLAAERGIKLEPGQWISTGAVTGVHAVRPGASIVARFGEAHELRCRITAATSRGA